jgi:hypothetical protein
MLSSIRWLPLGTAEKQRSGIHPTTTGQAQADEGQCSSLRGVAHLLAVPSTVVVGNGDCTDGPSPSFGGSGSFPLGVANARDS